MKPKHDEMRKMNGGISMKQIMVDFEFAKHMRDTVDEFTQYYAHPEYVNGQHQLWHEMCITLCPAHEWEEIRDEDGGVLGYENCKICGARNSWEEEAIWNKFKKTCSNCAFSEQSGGDIVPYGSTTTTLPEGISCLHPSFSDDTEELETQWLDWQDDYCSENNQESCPLWEGKKEGTD